MAILQEKSGSRGTEFVEYFRRNTCTCQILWNICRLHVFLMRNGVQENRDASKKVIFLLIVLPRICQLDGTWGALCLLCHLISVSAGGHGKGGVVTCICGFFIFNAHLDGPSSRRLSESISDYLKIAQYG